MSHREVPLGSHQKYVQAIQAQFQWLKLSYMSYSKVLENQINDQVTKILYGYQLNLTSLEEKLHYLTATENPDFDLIYGLEYRLKQATDEVQIHFQTNQKILEKAISLLKKEQTQIQKKLDSELPSKNKQIEYKNISVIFTDSIEMRQQLLILESNFKKIACDKSKYFDKSRIILKQSSFTITCPKISSIVKDCKTLEAIQIDSKYSDADLKIIMKQLALKIEGLHKQNIITANLCPSNIKCKISKNKINLILPIPNFNVDFKEKDHDYFIDDFRLSTYLMEGDQFTGLLITSINLKSDILSFIRIMHSMTKCKNKMKLINGGEKIKLGLHEKSDKYYQSLQLLLKIIMAYNTEQIKSMEGILILFQKEDFEEFYQDPQPHLKQQQQEPHQQEEFTCQYELECGEHKQKVKYSDGSKALCFLCVMDIYNEEAYAKQNSSKVIENNIFKLCQEPDDVCKTVNSNFETRASQSIIQKINKLEKIIYTQ